MTLNLLTDISWLKNNSHVLTNIKRGIEREGLRITKNNGSIAKTEHYKIFGSALTHKWITTDFAESLLEFITPYKNNIEYILSFLKDIHFHVISHLKNKNECIWPMSMPCYIDPNESIKLAQYGNSNIGRLKTIYREGLKNRYGTSMQLISGIHYNFSLPSNFWNIHKGIHYSKNKDKISYGYLCLIRNYQRFGWIIPYLFGASPGICPSFLKNIKTDIKFKKSESGLIYLPYATSLRLSNLGYTNKLQNNLNITFNDLNEYIRKLKKATKTPNVKYQNIGLKKNNNYLQLNTNILQMENELYLLIRPKRNINKNEFQSDELKKYGIEYIEVRSLDLNPFSSIGINKEQIKFLDLFLVWCSLINSPRINSKELFYNNYNWNQVVLNGRKPGLKLYINQGTKKIFLSTFGKYIFNDLKIIAKIFDSNYGKESYKQICDKFETYLDYPELTISAKLLDKLIDQGISKFGLNLSEIYLNKFEKISLKIINNNQFMEERNRSYKEQFLIEKSDNLSFHNFLKKYNN